MALSKPTKESSDFTILHLDLWRLPGRAREVTERVARFEWNITRTRDKFRCFFRIGLGVKQIAFTRQNQCLRFDRLQCTVVVAAKARCHSPTLC